MGKVLYAAAIQAENKTLIEAIPMYCIATNKHEATGKLLNHAMKKWPKGDGWEGHQVAVVAIERRFLEEVLSADDSEEEKQS